MVVEKESKLLEKKEPCARSGLLWTGFGARKEIDAETLGDEGAVRRCEISNFVTG